MNKPVQCRQCGEPVPHDRSEWATPMCHKCLPPIGTRRAMAEAMAEAINALAPSAYIVDYSTLLGTPEKKP